MSSTLLSTAFIALAASLPLAACGDGGNADGTTDTGPTVDADPTTRIDAGAGGIDAGASACGTTQCDNCLDDDGDGFVDGADIECTGAADNDEGSFATGIPGDNMDLGQQDCFFDGNSGGGANDCNIHVCCLLGLDAASCEIGPNFDPASCDEPQSQACIDTCMPLTPPGCDCFGCCTLCDPTTDECFDVLTHPAVAPDCDADSIDDPMACPRCEKVTACETPCDPAQCILCPGQDASDLPPECANAVCPDGLVACEPDGTCADINAYCSGGCCIGQID